MRAGTSALLTGLLLLAGGASAEPVAVLGRPGIQPHFIVYEDASFGIGDRVLQTWLAEPGALEPAEAEPRRLSWGERATRTVRAASRAGDIELTTLSGVALGAYPEHTPWLYQSIRLTNSAGAPRPARVCVELTAKAQDADLALRNSRAVMSGNQVQLAVPRDAAATEFTDSRALLAYDFQLDAGASAELLLAMPATPMAHEPRRLPDVTNLNPRATLADIERWWWQRLSPDTVKLGNETLDLAYQAAVASLILRPPGRDASAPDLAAAISSLARAGHVSDAAAHVETLIRSQQADGAFPRATELHEQAQLTTAVAECALYAESPGRWAQILRKPIDLAASYLLAAETPPTAAADVALALRAAADVAQRLKQPGRAAELRAHAAALLTDAAPPGATSPLSARARALSGKPLAPADASDPLASLHTAHLALLSGDGAAQLTAWDTVENLLEAAPLPGVRVAANTEETRFAAALVGLMADALVRRDGAVLHPAPALPAAWADEGPVCVLQSYPSGLGDLTYRLTAPDSQGRVTLSIGELPTSAERLRLTPALGPEFAAIRVRGKALSPEDLAAGPPWEVDAKAGKIIFLPEPNPL